MLVDNVILTVKAGDGGNGAATFLRNGQTAKGGPDGGSGGNGGNIYFQGSTNINDLREFRFKKKVLAQNGITGKRQKLFGANAPDTIIFVPLGTKITDTETGKAYEVTDQSTRVLVARGGKGGRGNDEFKSATNQTPTYAEKGNQGEQKVLKLELKLIADIGLIGLPNAGKSSLLAMLTNADPKIGDYPFTTLEPNIGMMGQYAIADIPGLIEGAALGKGLGINFLKHIEKTKILIHCIDSSGQDLEKIYNVVRNELKEHNLELLEKEEIILLTKTDLIDEAELIKKTKLMKKNDKKVLSVSLLNDTSINNLENNLKNLIQ